MVDCCRCMHPKPSDEIEKMKRMQDNLSYHSHSPRSLPFLHQQVHIIQSNRNSQVSHWTNPKAYHPKLTYSEAFQLSTCT